MATTVRYPTGVRPLLISETARRRRIEARVTSLLESEGFEEITLPLIDYDEPYAAVGAIDSRQSYRFVDRDGELVSIRSDFTPLVARALAPSMEPSTTLRVFYRGDVIRYAPSRLGANRETFQIGAEIVGDQRVEADAAVLNLVSTILRGFGVTPRIVYTDSSIPDLLGSTAREALASKQSSKVAALNSPLAAKLATGTATVDDLRACAVTSVAGERLAKLATLVGDECFAHLDDVDRSAGYYTGLRFRAYDGSSRVVVAQGGRYDTLYGKFGNAAPAAGFTLTIDDLD